MAKAPPGIVTPYVTRPGGCDGEYDALCDASLVLGDIENEIAEVLRQVAPNPD